MRASERLIGTDLDLRTGDLRQSERRLLHQPSLDIVLAAGLLEWTQGYEYQLQSSRPSPGADNDLERTEVLQRIDWTPVELPAVTAWIDHQTTRDDLFVDRDDTLSLVQAEETRGPFSYVISQRDEFIDDHRADVQEDRVDRTFRATYRDDHFDQRLTTSLSVFQETRHTVTEVPIGAATVPADEIPILGGFAAIDTSPEISNLPPLPSLVDGDDTTSTGVNIGGFVSGGELGWNLAASRADDAPIELALLSTVDPVDDFLLDQFSFSAWASEDGTFWTLVTGDVPFTYEQAFRRFRVQLPMVTAPFVKLVNTASPPAGPAVFVSDLRLFGTSSASPSSERTATRELTRSLTGNVSFRAADDLVLGYDLFVQRAERERDDVSTRDEDRVDNGLSALWTPSEIVDVSLRANDRRTQDATRLDETFRSYNGLLGIRPLDALDLALNWTSTWRERDGLRDFETSALRESAGAQLLETLEAEVAFEQSTQKDIANDRIVTRDIVSASTTANVTRDVDLTLSARDVSATVEGSGAADIPDPDERITEALLVYQPSSQLTAEVDFEWRDTFAGSGLDRRVRLDWIPFPEGSLDVQLDAQRLSSELGATSVDRYQMLTRWTMNPSVFVEFNWARLVPDTGDRSTTTSLALNGRF
ncbi:MAG: hypothetical protein H6825_08175 [Planctomycetes bacterium]|nr:hypothetical protein [Planctomycetota bacterium]